MQQTALVFFSKLGIGSFDSFAMFVCLEVRGGLFVGSTSDGFGESV